MKFELKVFIDVFGKPSLMELSNNLGLEPNDVEWVDIMLMNLSDEHFYSEIYKELEVGEYMGRFAVYTDNEEDYVCLEEVKEIERRVDVSEVISGELIRLPKD